MEIARNKSLPSLTAPNSHHECCISMGIDAIHSTRSQLFIVSFVIRDASIIPPLLFELDSQNCTNGTITLAINIDSALLQLFIFKYIHAYILFLKI